MVCDVLEACRWTHLARPNRIQIERFSCVTLPAFFSCLPLEILQMQQVYDS